MKIRKIATVLLFIAVATGAGMGCTVIISQLFGAKNYKKIGSAALYRAWADKMATTPLKDMKFSEQGFNTMLGVYYYGMTDDETTTKNTPSYLNKYAGSLEGWSVVIGTDKKPTRTMNPNFGSVRLGESGTASGKTELRTAPIMSDKLSETVATPCIVTVKVSAHSTTEQNINVVLGVYHYRGDQIIDNKNTIQFNLDENGNVKYSKKEQEEAQKDFDKLFKSFDSFKTLKSIYVAKNTTKEALRDKASDSFSGK